MADMVLNTAAVGPINVNDEILLTLDVPKAAKYVLELGGSAQVRVGVFQGDQVVGSNGKLSVCGTTSWGVRELVAGTHLIRIQGLTAGNYSVKLRPWSFSDYVLIYLHKSACQ